MIHSRFSSISHPARSVSQSSDRLQMMKDVMGPFQDIPGPEISTGSKVSITRCKQAPGAEIYYFTHFPQLKGFLSNLMTTRLQSLRVRTSSLLLFEG